MTPERRNDVLALTLLTSIITALFIDLLAGVNCLYIRDIVQYAYPGKKVLRDVVAGGEFPYWNRVISGGQPLAANPAHEVFYPLTWLILLPSFDYGFQLFILVHIYLAAFGMYAFLRSLGMGAPASFFGGLSFGIGGLVMSYAALLPLLAAIVWVPPALLFGRRFLLHRLRRDFALAAVFLGLQLLVGEPTTVLQSGILLGMYAIANGVRRRSAPTVLRNVAVVGLISIAAALAAAVSVLPMIDHAGDSIRARPFPYSTVIDWSTPPARIAELLYPNVLGHVFLNDRALYWGHFLYPERGGPFAPSIYPGLLITVFAVAGVFARVRGTGLFLATVLVSFLLAAGDHTPLWRLLYDLGVVSSLRYPEKFVLMGVLAVIVFGARTLDVVLGGDEGTRRMALVATAATTLVAGAGVGIALTPWYGDFFAAAWDPAKNVFLEMLAAARSGWVLATARGLLLIILIRTVARARRPVWLGIAALFVVLDLATLLPELVRRTSADYLREPPRILQQLPPNHSDYRLFHHGAWHRGREQNKPFFSGRPEQYAVRRNAALPLIPAAHGVQTVVEVDYDFTALLPTADFVDAVWKLSDLTPAWIEITASMSNVWYRAVLRHPDEAFAEVRGDATKVQPVFLREHPHYPRYYFARLLEPIRDRDDFIAKAGSRRYPLETTYIAGPPFAPAPGTVRNVRETANTARLEVETAGRAYLVMSVTPHKYWTVTIDGRVADPIVTNVGYQGIVIPNGGRHVVEMRYRNPLIATGGAISVATLLALFLAARRRDRERPAAPPAPGLADQAAAGTMRAL